MSFNINNWFNDFIKAAESYFKDPILIILGFIIIGQYIIYQFLSGIFFKPRDRKIYSGEVKRHVFSDKWTILLQEKIGTKNWLAWSLAAYYVGGFAVCTLVSIPLIATIILNGGEKRIWIYLLITIIMWFIDIIVFIWYPVGPPIRVSQNVKYTNVRAQYFPWSDSLIGMHHNALPSGHIWTLSLAWVAAIAEGIWVFIGFYTINFTIACVVIIYTGDHYPIDILGALICVSGLYALFWIILFF